MAVKWFFWPAVACVIAVVGTLQAGSALGETQTWDEGIHLSAGYAYVTRGDYTWNAEHPPLVKILAALPLTRMGLDFPVDGEGWKLKDNVRLGIDFLYRNKRPADEILFAGRVGTMLLTLGFVAGLAWWTRRRFGDAAGLLAATLCAFDPNLIAHGRYVTTDAPVTAFYFFTCVLWVQYLENRRLTNLIAASAAFALALVTKYSAVLLIPTMTILFAAAWAQRPKEFSVRRAALASGVLLATLAVVAGLVYWPETIRCLRGEAGPLANVVDRGNFVGKWMYRFGQWFHLPAHRFLEGLSRVASHNAGGHSSYLLGMRSETGFWYYFPVVFAVKSTIAALIATAVAAAAVLAWIFGVRRAPASPGARRAREWVEAVPLVWVGLLFPPLFYFVFSMTSGINLGLRHILPVYPFLYVAAAAALSRVRLRSAALCGMAALGALQIGECASIAPDYLAFFNAAAGGPGNGPRYLIDSNIDWGQDVKKLARWLDAHGTRKAQICYFGNAQMRYYGIDEGRLPNALDAKGWEEIDDYVVANVTPLNGGYVPLVDLAPLRWREPIAKIGWSMYVYDFRKPKKAAAH